MFPTLDQPQAASPSRVPAALSVPSGNIRFVENAFYQAVSRDTFVATSATVGPWSADAQHGGPPSALAARALELHEPDPRQRLARVCVDILRPVPIGKISVRTRTVRPGRRVALVEAVLEADGQDVLHARGWRIERPDGEVPEVLDQDSARDHGPGGEVPPVGDGPTPPIFEHAPDGYLQMIEWRFMSGAARAAAQPETENGAEPVGHGQAFAAPAVTEAAPAVTEAAPAVTEAARGRTAQARYVWTRPRLPLILGEEPTPMSRALLVADSGSGVSAALPPSGFIFINVDLTVVLPRDPAGEWLLLEASTAIGADGTGLATTRLSDQQGSVGRAWQTLLVAPRPQP
jgi:Thioesterase-like superfamily